MEMNWHIQDLGKGLGWHNILKWQGSTEQTEESYIHRWVMNRLDGNWNKV